MSEEKTSTECMQAQGPKKIGFAQLKKEIKKAKVKFRSDKDWEIFLPSKTSTECINKVISICRSHLLVTWHIMYTDPTEDAPKPEIRVYWDTH